MAHTVLGEAPARGPRTFASLFQPHVVMGLVGVFYLLVTNGVSLWVPRLINQAVGHLENSTPDEGSRPVLRLVALIIGITVVGAGFRVLSRMALFSIGRQVERDLRSELFAHVSTLSPSWYRKTTVGDVMSRLTNDLSNIRLMAGFALLNALNALMTFAGTLPLMIALDWRVACLSLMPFPLVIALSQGASRIMFRRTRENQEALGRLTAAVQENLAGQAVVRAFSREAEEERTFSVVNDGLYQTSMRLANVRLVMFPLAGLMGALAIAIALLASGAAVEAGRMDVGDILEMTARLQQLAWPTVALGFIMSVYQRGKASLSRVNDVLMARPEIVDGSVRGALTGAFSATGLTVCAPDAGMSPLLDGVDLSVKAGEVLGVVGRSGSGKTTLVRVLARLQAVPDGQLAYDGVDVNRWHLSDVHRDVAVVPDDGFLFSASLRDNLAFACPDATDEDIVAVVSLCDLQRDVKALPDGLDTLVGERGITLSGGQRQRVALARAVLARPRVLILDDSLSAVDAETETRIVASLRQGFAGLPKKQGRLETAPTLVVVSHRLSAVRAADEIIVLDHGRVSERGTHGQLLARGGTYATLVREEQLRKALDAGSLQEVA